MGCGAHLESLRRTSSGDFTLEQARTLAELELLAVSGKTADALIPAAKLLPAFPAVVVDPGIVAQIRQGRNFPVSPFRNSPASKYVKAVSREGDLVAVGEARLPNLYHPVVVL